MVFPKPLLQKFLDLFLTGVAPADVPEGSAEEVHMPIAHDFGQDGGCRNDGAFFVRLRKSFDPLFREAGLLRQSLKKTEDCSGSDWRIEDNSLRLISANELGHGPKLQICEVFRVDLPR